MSTDADPQEVLRKSAWDESFHCYGRAFVLEQRVLRFERAFFAYDLASFGFPIFVGLAAVTFKVDQAVFKMLATVGSLVGFAAMLFSFLCLIGRWREKLQSYQREIVMCSTLFDDYRRFAKSPPRNEFRKQFDLLEVRRQEAEKTSATLTEEEKRFGYRYAARQFERECPECGIKPVNMVSTDCPICGQFQKKFK